MLSWVSSFIPYVWLSHLVSSLQRAPGGPPAINTIEARAKVQSGRRFFRMPRPEVYFTHHPVIHSSHTFSLVMSRCPCQGPSVRTSAGLIYPMVQRHTYIVNLSSCCCTVVRHQHHQCLDSIGGDLSCCCSEQTTLGHQISLESLSTKDSVTTFNYHMSSAVMNNYFYLNGSAHVWTGSSDTWLPHVWLHWSQSYLHLYLNFCFSSHFIRLRAALSLF